MIDIETLGKGPNSVILSIGAVQFDIETGDILDEFYQVVNPQTCIDIGMEMDIDTILWWIKKDVAGSLLFEINENASDIETSLIALAMFVTFGEEDVRIWAKSPRFDIVILESAYKRCDIEYPWSYNRIMDLRTLMEIYDGDRPKFDIQGFKHNALYDAKLQAKICSHIWNHFVGGSSNDAD